MHLTSRATSARRGPATGGPGRRLRSGLAHHPAIRVLVAPALGVLAAVPVAVVAQSRPLTAARAGAVFSALILLVTELVLVRRARGRADRLAIQLLAGALLVLAVSQALIAGDAGDPAARYPTAGTTSACSR